MADPQPAPTAPPPSTPEIGQGMRWGGVTQWHRRTSEYPRCARRPTRRKTTPQTRGKRRCARPSDKLRLALPALQSADKSLAQHVESIARQASDPVRFNQRSFQHEIAYAVQDTTKVLGSRRAFRLTTDDQRACQDWLARRLGSRVNDARALLTVHSHRSTIAI